MTLNNTLTVRILLFMLAGIIFGFLTKILLMYGIRLGFINNFLVAGGNIFLSLMQVLAIPIVFISIVSGVCSFDKFHFKSLIGSSLVKWFIITTILASLLAIFVADFFNIGSIISFDGVNGLQIMGYKSSFWQFVGSIVPQNPIHAMLGNNMIQVVVFSTLFGVVISASGENGKRIASFFSDLNVISIKAVALFMRLVPFGIFCLMAVLFASKGLELILGMLEYFVIVLFALSLHTIITFSLLLSLFQLSPKAFFKKINSVVLFAFGVSSSNVSVPVALDAVEHKLGVGKSVSSLAIPFGSNINKNGTAIVHVIATIFIANIYHVSIDITGYISLILMVMFLSIGTSGAPGFGLITLVMILKQLGLPIEGIALVIGVDRLLDMVRTSVNVTGNAVVACLIGESKEQLNQKVYNSFSSNNNL